ncbi:TPA: translesion error-prone DNA polymerase V subunit UmuC [Enterobacter hormaechei]|uniref:translesion error-prone DNA polymerase V subunit UmuC n=1 Tax=Duffyella gerundensis TaxID=1619313 RepID=UPI0016541CAA|nr:translesion error-prone DNA polymerase V subunit UmuC [Duffyella gerundensis]HBM2521668.1 translesion error-prone DNA polymerase V subunit UmuC [Enterobacter hormaechei]HBM2531216.1 translesion error-prone DNA polymerase V subunit UmuC [Enterobacter hormaechei]HBM2647495.1 translesion error-prone DNA polymerase V subunit UmuC [Enterobacter hormaechei]HBM2672322.1 translesion error-prone DNA polymerase V subunit UmuC [Enterobacter hormaechei]HDR1962368.1 translesion error-prone DNA polymeras
MYALADANNFYASCESVFRPDLRGKPICVVSNNDGCVIARSAEAKRLGIKMAAPYFKHERFFRDNGVYVFSSNYELYGDLSARMMAILGEMAGGQEIYSIDESFLDVTGIGSYMPLEAFGQSMRERIRRETGLTIGVGFGPTKTLAKLANHAAKKWTKTNGVVDLSESRRQRKLLQLTDVGDVWGIGWRINQRLKTLGIMTALQLADSDIRMLRKNFDVIIERTARELRGESCLALEDAPGPKQQIVNSRSFGERVTRLEDMQQAVASYAARAAEKLRAQGSRCRHVTVSIATGRYGTEPQYSHSAPVTSEYPTADTRDITGMALRGLASIWRDGYRYAKAGVILSDFWQSDTAQFDLFSEQLPRANADALMAALDGINRSGKGKVWFAGQGTGESIWQMKRNMLSPRYTTRFADIPVVK